MVVFLFCATSLVSAEEMKIPKDCVAASGATASHGGYASRVTHQKTGIELILVPAGSFKLGDREITFARPFYVGKAEVTNGQYKRFTEQSGYDGRPDVDPGYDMYLLHIRGKSIMPTGDNFPVVYVSWHNAKAFCRWSGALDLPSNAEWQYCLDAGPRTEGRVTDNSGGNPHEVARMKPNSWGIYDLYGNVWEWCLDDFANDVPFPSDGSARYADRMTKILRGGAWSTANHVAGKSVNSAPGNAANDAGFRVVLRLP